ncbi:ArsR/SmtB family transcription factor [Streptomyces mashuensis]
MRDDLRDERGGRVAGTAAGQGPGPGELIEVFKALGNPARLQIMQWLKDPETHFAAYEPIADRRTVGVCVTHIQAKSGLAQSTVSSYMSTLERAGLVRPTRVGKWTHYRRDEERLAEVARAIGTEV